MSVLLLGPFALALLARTAEYLDRTAGSVAPQPIAGRRATRRAQIAAVFMFLLLLVDPAGSCGPGRSGRQRPKPRKLTPLVFKQHVPNVAENTLAASGLREGKLTKVHPRFKELTFYNHNNDVIFKDEEGTGADRLMTKRCIEKLTVLAISVMNHFPGVKLRVTEGWDEEGHHGLESLHYEGRAVDITTSDRDRSKYGMLARLAVDAGFDWVYYEARSHIHCSVKSESTYASRSTGCFPAEGRVVTYDRGTVPISDIKLTDSVLSMSSDGNLIFSEVILFMDRDADSQLAFVEIVTEAGSSIVLTPSHLIYVLDEVINATDSSGDARFANSVRPGQYVLVAKANSTKPAYEKVTDIRVKVRRGVYAPLTETGNLVVDGVVVSCYALVNSQRLAHWAFFPVRFIENAKEAAWYLLQSVAILPSRTNKPSSHQEGIHWYAKLLYGIAGSVMPRRYLYNEG